MNHSKQKKKQQNAKYVKTNFTQLLIIREKLMN